MVDDVDFVFRLESIMQQPTDLVCSHHWLSPTGEILLSYRKQKTFHWLLFPYLAKFRVSTNTSEITCYPITEIPEETVRHLLLDQVLPRCLAYQGRIMLHASAVQLERGLLLFIGDSGAGKSTLAGDFHQMGQPVVSDDCLWVKEEGDQVLAVPSYGGLRLWEDSLEVLFAAQEDARSMAHYSAKKRVSLRESDLSEFSNGIPVLAVIALSPPDQTPSSKIILERLSHREAFIALLKQTFQLDVTDLDRMTRHMRALGDLVPRLPAYRLTMKHDYALLPLVRHKILERVL